MHIMFDTNNQLKEYSIFFLQLTRSLFSICSQQRKTMLFICRFSKSLTQPSFKFQDDKVLNTIPNDLINLRIKITYKTIKLNY